MKDIYEIRPATLFGTSWMIWLVFLAISPGTYIVPGGKVFPTFILIVYNIVFLAGILYEAHGEQLDPTRSKILFSKSAIRGVTTIILGLGMIGILLRIDQRLGEGISLDIVSNRTEQLKAGEATGGVTSVLAALLFPLATIALYIAILLKDYFRNWERYTIFVICSYSIIDSLLSASRSTVFFQGVAILIAVQMRNTLMLRWTQIPVHYWRVWLSKSRSFRLRSTLLRPKYIAILVSSILIMAVFFITIQSLRSSTYETNYPWKVIVKFTEASRMFDFDPAAKTRLETSSEPLLVYAGYGLVHYAAHGPFEFMRWVNATPEYLGLYHGKYELYIFVKFFKIFGVDTGADFMAMTSATTRPGVFTTFWGPVYLDFGVLGLIPAFLMGMLSQLSYRAAVRGRILGLLTYPLVGSVIFSMSVINALVGANTYYFVAAFTTTFILLVVEEYIQHLKNLRDNQIL